MTTFIELHLLQNFAPSCLNRDDTNTPKDCVFGGVRRARISSQCIKRAVRCSPTFLNTLEMDKTNRARFMKEKLEEEIKKVDSSKTGITDFVGKFINCFVKKAGKENDEKEPTPKKGDKKGEDRFQICDAAMWLSPRDLKSVVEYVSKNMEQLKKKGELGNSVNNFLGIYKNFPQTPDISLFGRMLANATALNVDAACQVAHAISTHKVEMEMDFFTAVDDLQPKDNAGAGMMGTVEFNSACFYRYAVIDWEKLLQNLDEDRNLARRTVEAFLRASVEAIPTGKQNTFAAHNPPSFLLGSVKERGTPWSLANAFEKPVRANGNGLVAESIQALDAYWGPLTQMYGHSQTRLSWLQLGNSVTPQNLAETDRAANVDEFVQGILEALS